jgi:hypothetical protein
MTDKKGKTPPPSPENHNYLPKTSDILAFSSVSDSGISDLNLQLPPEIFHDAGGGERPRDTFRLDNLKLDLKELFEAVMNVDPERYDLIGKVARLNPTQYALVKEFVASVEGNSSIDVASSHAAERKLSFPLWKDRPSGRGTNPAKWITDHHSDLIKTEGARAAIRRRDPDLIMAYAQWIKPNRHPEDDLRLDTQRRRNLSQMSPEAALQRKREQNREANQRFRTKL